MKSSLYGTSTLCFGLKNCGPSKIFIYKLKDGPTISLGIQRNQGCTHRCMYNYGQHNLSLG